jgi:GT2 family glycosyltransferase
VKISVIFLCHNNSHINLCVNAAQGQLTDGDEIIVVDDHSDVVPSCDKNVRLIQADTSGNRSRNRNLGAAAAGNGILLFMDGDMVLCPGALQAIRTGYAQNKAVAFVGHKHNIRYSDTHSKLFTGMSYKRYIELLQTEKGRIQLMDSPLFYDNSAENFKHTDLSQYFWLYYYSGACSVVKSLFEAVGGFDENFTTWGGEDTDLGYRIAKVGNIGFLNQFRSIHIPHGKDVIAQEISSKQNIMKMLKKYNRWEFEVLHSFNSGLDVFRSFHNVINQMRMVDTTLTDMDLPANGMVVYPVSSKHPNGMVVTHDGEQESLCMATDYADKQFDVAYALDTIFIYPIVIASRILQELCRVSKRVLIVPTKEKTRIDWRGRIALSGKSNSKIIYRCGDIDDFVFRRVGDGLIEVSPVVLRKWEQMYCGCG